MYANKPAHPRINFGVNTELDAAAIYTPIHPIFKEVDAIAISIGASHEVTAAALLAAFTCVNQHWVTVSHPLDSEAIIKIMQYYLTLAPSGGKKSLVSDSIFEPIVEHQLTLDKVNKQTPLELKQAKALWKTRKSALLSELKAAYKKEDESIDELEQELKNIIAQEPQKVHPIQLLLDGVTVAGLKKALALSPIHPMMFSSEAIAFLNELAADTHFITLLNRAWDGKPMAFESYREKFNIADPRLSMLLMTQTSVFLKKLCNNPLMQDSGFWARCLISVAAPSGPAAHIASEDVQTGKEVIKHIHEKLRAQLESPQPRHLTLSNTADMEWKRLFNITQNNLKMPNTKEAFTPAFAAKMPEHILRLAAVIHLMYEKGDIIDIASIQAAASLVNSFHETQLRLFSNFGTPQLYRDAQKLHYWLIMHRSGYPFTKMQTINNCGPVNSRDLDSLKEQLEVLRCENKIYTVKNGKSTEVYLVWRPYSILPNNNN
ncbi:DUF3987 domain-containing protein [Aeromonas veronii]